MLAFYNGVKKCHVIIILEGITISIHVYIYIDFRNIFPFIEFSVFSTSFDKRPVK